MDKPKVDNNKIKWSPEEQAKINEALRKAALEAEIEKKLREQKWSAPTTN